MFSQRSSLKQKGIQFILSLSRWTFKSRDY